MALCLHVDTFNPIVVGYHSDKKNLMYIFSQPPHYLDVLSITGTIRNIQGQELGDLFLLQSDLDYLGQNNQVRKH